MVGSSEGLIWEISSDEEEENNYPLPTADFDNADWLSHIFPTTDNNNNNNNTLHVDDDDDDDDDDEVVVIGEVFANPSLSVNNSRVVKKEKIYNDDDDDCVILDCDPEKPKNVLKHNISDDDDDSDDLCIVGQKGEIACRDYPHARHLCAKFLFASTPHEQHCHQCHCYVCDSIAPCIHWGNGSSKTDHCHSTDRDPLWKARRESFKRVIKAPLPLQPPDTPLILPPQTIPISVSTPAPSQISTGSAIIACTRRRSPNISNSAHNLQTRLLASPRDTSDSCLVSQHLPSSCSNNDAKLNLARHAPRDLGAHSLNHPRNLKRPGSQLVARPSSRSRYGTTNNNNASQYPRHAQPSANLSKGYSTYQQNNSVTGSNSQQNYDGSSRGSVPASQAQGIGSNSFPSSNSGQPQAFNNQFGSDNSFENTVTFQQSSLQTNMGSTFVDPTPQPSQGFSHSSMNCLQNQAPFQQQVLPQPDTGGTFAFPSSESYSQANTGINNFENAVPFPSPALSQPSTGGYFVNPGYTHSQTNYQPNAFQQGNEIQSATNPSFANNIPSVAGAAEEYNPEDPALPYQTPSLLDYDSSTILENADNQYSYFCDPSWIVEYAGGNGFDSGHPEDASVGTDPIFHY